MLPYDFLPFISMCKFSYIIDSLWLPFNVVTLTMNNFHGATENKFYYSYSAAEFVCR